MAYLCTARKVREKIMTYIYITRELSLKTIRQHAKDFSKLGGAERDN